MSKPACLYFLLSMVAAVGCGDDDASQPECGNDILEFGEVCDGESLHGMTCADLGAFTGGTLSCNGTCDDYITTGCLADCPTAAQDVTSSIGSSTMVDTAGASDDFTGSCGDPGAPDTLLSFVAPTTATYLISTDNPGTDYDTLLWSFTDCMDATTTETACNDDINRNLLQSTILVSATAGEVVYIVVDGFAAGGYAESGSAEVSLTEINCTDDGNEDDDTESTATPLTGGFPLSGGGVLCPDDISGDFGFPIDFYTLDIPAGHVLDASILAGTTTDCTQQTLAIQFLDPGLENDLGAATGDSTDCASLQGVANPTGTQVVMAVFEPTTGTPVQDYNFLIVSRPILCGDGIADLGEPCDDGNTVPDDGCENDCSLTPPCVFTADVSMGTLASATAITEVVDLTVQTHDLATLGCITAEGGAGGEDYMYSFTITTAGTLTVDLDHTGGDVLYGLFADDTTCAEVDCFDLFPDVTGQVTATVTPGDYRFVVQAYGMGGGASVSATFTAP